MIQPFTARYSSGKCAECKRPIQKGEEITLVKGGYRHSICSAEDQYPRGCKSCGKVLRSKENVIVHAENYHQFQVNPETGRLRPPPGWTMETDAKVKKPRKRKVA